jgi:hypothetical protein
MDHAPVTIVVKPHKLEKRGMRYAAFVEGREICQSRTPFLAGARALRAEGHADDTRLEMKHEGSDVVCLRAKLGVAAGLAIVESDTLGLVFHPWVPFAGIPG